MKTRKKIFDAFLQQKKILILLLIQLLLGVFSLPAQVQLNDSAKVSILTASPWYGAVYAFFGHTAIRVQDDSTGVDVVFNYGYFDSSQSHFIYNFVRGKTDYSLGDISFQMFLNEYAYRGQEVVEQELNLLPSEKQQLFDALNVNLLPENRIYRYNYFYDNCTTRPRDLIEKYTKGDIRYIVNSSGKTYRDLLHECVDNNYLWLQFGIDLVIGGQADRVIDVREQMFLPNYLMNSLDGAVIQRNDSLSVPLMKSKSTLLPVNKELNSKSEGSFFSPIIVALALLILTMIVSLVQAIFLNKIGISKIYDTLLFSLSGFAGIVILTLMFFSEHPATNPNWNFVWLNPCALVAVFFFWMKSAKKVVYFYHFINFAVLTLFLLTWWLMPQQIPLAAVLFSVNLWLRSGVNIYLFRRTRLKSKQFTTSRYLKAGWGGL